jgi:hypothetical protein
MASSKWCNWRGQSEKCQEDPRVRRGDRTGPKWAWVSQPRLAGLAHSSVGSAPISWAWRWCNPKYVEAPPFAEREREREPFAREAIHKLEKKERREIIRKEDRSTRRKQPQVVEDRSTQRKTPSEASPWSIVLCLAPWWVIFSFVHGL